MKMQNVGIAFLLLGLILAVSAVAQLYWMGFFLGIIGFIIVIAGGIKKSSNDEGN